jgi:hypothetical protein
MAPSKKPFNLSAKSHTAELTSNLKEGLFKNLLLEKCIVNIQILVRIWPTLLGHLLSDVMLSVCGG